MTENEGIAELVRTCRALDRKDLTQEEWDAEWRRLSSVAAEVEADGGHLELESLAMMSPAMRPKAPNKEQDDDTQTRTR